MGINIDSFLDNLSNQGQKNSDKGKKEEEKISLEFEEDLKNKIVSLQKAVGEKDFDFLVKAYEEMKKFDETLPSRLFSIGMHSGNALSDLSSKYSKTYLQAMRSNMNSISMSISANLKNCESSAQSGNFQEALASFSEAARLFRVFPKEFSKEKNEVGSNLRECEIRLNERFAVYKREEIKKTKLLISDGIIKLRESLVVSNILEIEKRINELNAILDRMPKVFYSDLILERVHVSKALGNAYDFLAKEYERDFNERKAEIFRLFDKFARYKISNDVNNALLIYDEMVIIFSKMPDVFLDQKIEIFERLNKTFDSLNSLIMTSNMNMFVRTYEYGKILDEVREYVEHAKISGSCDLNVLLDLKKKIGQIPLSFKKEVLDLVSVLDRLIANFQRKSPQSFSAPLPSVSQSSQSSRAFSDSEDDNSDLVSAQGSPDAVKSNVAIEINECFRKLLATKSKNEAVRYARKIDFYLDMLKVSESAKSKIKARVKSALDKK